MMESVHILILILFHQVVFHSCRSPDPPGLLDSDDDDLKYEDVKSILRVVPYPGLIKWNDNYSRIPPEIKKHNAVPIAIILSPSNIATKFQYNQKVPELDRDTKNLMGIYADGFTGTGEKTKTVDSDHKENFVIKHQLIDEKVKSPTVKSHNYTRFIADKTFMEDNDDSSHEILSYSNSVRDAIESSVDDKNEFNNGVLDDITTEDNTGEERKEKEVFKHLFTPESINKNDFTYFNIIDTKLHHLSENNDGDHDLNKDSSKLAVNYIFGEQLNKVVKVFILI
ncbi:uncharacterized protein LOC123717669 [Pieris brassicae]|uniref:uncharacterized protein LOC123717669 n=1 Tax=Pieris brassicae TaxID=7116 RepID=UPI001E66045A|nr:uncharacterized protein LOC123717669 [Pieris brassicae]